MHYLPAILLVCYWCCNTSHAKTAIMSSQGSPGGPASRRTGYPHRASRLGKTMMFFKLGFRFGGSSISLKIDLSQRLIKVSLISSLNWWNDPRNGVERTNSNMPLGHRPGELRLVLVLVLVQAVVIWFVLMLAPVLVLVLVLALVLVFVLIVNTSTCGTTLCPGSRSTISRATTRFKQFQEPLQTTCSDSYSENHTQIWYAITYNIKLICCQQCYVVHQ